MAFTAAGVGIAVAAGSAVYGGHEANKQKQMEEDAMNQAKPQPAFQGLDTAAQLNAANQKAQAAGGTLLAQPSGGGGGMGSGNGSGKTLLGA